MYVRWKPLLVLGLMLWLLLCMTDYILEGERYNRLERTDTSDWPMEEDYESNADVDEITSEINLSIFLTNISNTLVKLVVYNLLAFFASFGSCWILRRCFTCLFKVVYSKKLQICKVKIKTCPPPIPSPVTQPNKEVVMTAQMVTATCIPPTRPITNSNSTSKIPIATSRSSSQIDIREVDANNTEYHDASSDEKTSKKTIKVEPATYTSRSLEKRCAELREEMLATRAAALKENGTLSRKLEALAREKRELSKRLAISNKENRAAKHQMEELLSERAVLLSRLDSATKEFKANTRSKKVALEKLEEAQATIEKLEAKLEQVTRDKEVLERKFRAIEQELVMMKARDDKFGATTGTSTTPRFLLDCAVQTEPGFGGCGDKKEHVIDKGEQKAADDRTVSQAEIDMQKIQQKIMSLEKNLERFGTRKITKTFLDGNNSTLEPNDGSDYPKESESDQDIFYKEIERNERKLNANLGGIDLELESLRCAKGNFNASSTEDLYLYPISEECFCSVTEETIPSAIRPRSTYADEYPESSLNQAEIDMQRIQSKIFNLEKNLLSYHTKPPLLNLETCSPKEANIMSNYLKVKPSSASHSPSDQSSDLYSSSASCLGSPDTTPDLNAPYPQHFVTTSPAFQNFLKMLSVSQKSKETPRTMTGTVY